MRTRILTPEEFEAVRTAELPPSFPYAPPGDMAVVVVEDDEGRVVASMWVLKVTLFENLHIDPAYRKNAGVMRALLRQAWAIPRTRGEGWALAAREEDNEEMRGYLERLPGKAIGNRFHALRIGGT